MFVNSAPKVAIAANSWTVEALHVATLELDQDSVPVFSYLLRDGTRFILVDIGTPEPATVARRWQTRCEYGGAEPLIKQLGARELAPDDIDVILLSHLHFDHAGNLDLFPKANVVVHKQEVVHAIDPVPSQRGAYTRQITCGLLSRKQPHQLTLLRDRITHIAPGLCAVLIPGHTPGLLGYVATTARGKVGLPSDAGERYESWCEPGSSSGEHVPVLTAPRIRSEGERETLTAMAEFYAFSDIIVPSHDWRIPRQLPLEWRHSPFSSASGAEDA